MDHDASPAPALAAAVQILSDIAEIALEPLVSPEAQAFSIWLQAYYLFACLSVAPNYMEQSLLMKRLYRMQARSESVLQSSPQRVVASLANQLFRERHDMVDSFALRALAAHLPLGTKTYQLMGWVDIAWGNAPQAYANLPYFAVRATGALYTDTDRIINATPDVYLLRGWRTLPPFWRMIYVISVAWRNVEDPAETILRRVISRLALPLPFENERAISFSNLVALCDQAETLFGPAINPRDATLFYRLLQPWSGATVDGAQEAAVWLQWISTLVSAETPVIFPNSIFLLAFRKKVVVDLAVRYDDPAENISLEAVRATQKDDDLDDDDGGSPENTPDTTDDSSGASGITPPTLVNNNNSIDDITLAQDDGGDNAYLYRRAVLVLDDILSRDPNINVSQDVRQTLRLWCRDWLWLASVTQTTKLINDLGLRKLLEPVAKKD